MLHELRQGRDVVLTGFSQGAAVATLALVRLMSHAGWRPAYARQVVCVTFAGPLAMTRAMGDTVTSVVVSDEGEQPLVRGSDLFHHYVFERDIVPCLLTLVPSMRKPAERLARLLGPVSNAGREMACSTKLMAEAAKKERLHGLAHLFC